MNKYAKQIKGLDGQIVEVDVYAVLKAFNVTCPARQHAVKKILCTGERGKGDYLQDMREAIEALERGLDL